VDRPSRPPTAICKTVSHMQEVMARSGKVLLVIDKAGAETRSQTATWAIAFVMRPAIRSCTDVYALPARMLAYQPHLARAPMWTSLATSGKIRTVE